MVGGLSDTPRDISFGCFLPPGRLVDYQGATPWTAWSLQPAGAEVAALAVAVGADRLPACQDVGHGHPLMVPATAVLAAWPFQPYSLFASVGVVPRLLALVAGGVPPGLNGVVVRVCQGLLAILFKSFA